MLAIRMQRTGRKGHAQFRVVVQDSRQTPSSGRVIAGLGNYNPHTKETKIDAEKAAFYLKNGAQPSDRVAAILKKEGVELPTWVTLASDKKQKTIKNAEKLRKNRPVEEAAVEEPVVEEAQAESEESAVAEEKSEA